MEHKKEAAHEVPVQEQLSVKIEITNADEFHKLINETIDNLNKIKNFKFKTKATK